MSAAFEPDTTRYSAANALRLGEAARLAYADRAGVARQADSWGMKSEFIEDSKTGTQGFVASDTRAVILAFRGTENKCIQDIAIDVAVRLTPGTFGRVHTGFQEAIDSVWERVEVALKTAQTRGQSLWITGHSLGGALAVLAAAKLVDRGKPVYGLYTFGQPRVGDAEFADKMNIRMQGRMFRYVNYTDVVPRVPPRVLKYADTSECFYFNSGGVLEADTAAWYRFLDSVPVEVEKIRAKALNTIADHAMDKYLEGLRREIGSEPRDGGGGIKGLLRRWLGLNA